MDNLIIFFTFLCREPFTPGETSKEKEIQDNREKNVLTTIYFSKEATPSTPHEADPESGSAMKSNEPAFIPLEDSEADENSEFPHKDKGKKHALKKYDHFALNTCCFWGSTGSNITSVVQFHEIFVIKIMNTLIYYYS